MVHLSTRFIFSVIYLSYRAPHLMAATFCPDDPHQSGCWMCNGSDLRGCWNEATAIVDACQQEDDVAAYLKCNCEGYAKIALCWSRGRCCTEYAPTLAAASNVCNLHTHPKDSLTKDLVEKVVKDAYNVREAIWTNNSGKDVPKMSVYIKAYSNNDPQQESYHAQSTPTKALDQDKYSISHKSSFENENAKPKDGSHYKGQPHTETLQKDKNTYKLQSIDSSEKSPAQDINPQAYKSTPQSHSTRYEVPKSSEQVHHHAKCSRQQHKCQAEIASQYHKARRDTSHGQKLGKRGRSTLSPRMDAQLWKRSERINSKGEPECGIDFQGVPYPSEVPATVAKVFSEL